MYFVDTSFYKRIIDENKRETRLSYDAFGRLAAVHHPDGSRQELGTDKIGRITSVTDELGNTTSFIYNGLDKMVQSIDPLGAVTRFTYDERQHKTGRTNALGYTVRYEYSPNGNLIRETDAMGEVITYDYDAEENRISKTWPNKTGVRYSYDRRNRKITKITIPGRLTTTFEYDKAGRRVAVTDANGHRVSYSYDALDRIIAVTDPTGSITRREYDGAGNLINVIDGNGNPLSYEYDLRNRLISRTDALGHKTLYEYDPVGNLIATVTPKGARIEYGRDVRNRLTKVLYPDGDHKEFTYDPTGRIIRMVHGDSLEIRHYDSRGQLIMTDNAKGDRIQYSYDLLGNRISMTGPDGSTTQYFYNPRNKLVRQEDATGISRFDYDNMGRELTATLPDGSITRRKYNKENRLERLITSSKSGEILTSFLYSYDNIGNKLSMTEEDGGVTQYSYDAANRLTKVDYPKREMLPEVVSYTYDRAGNRIKTVEDGRVIISRYNRANQLLQSGDTRYSYDNNGNRISKTTEEGTSFYHYTADNFLSAFISPTGLKTLYGYDALNRRVLKESSDRKETFLYDGIKVLQEQTTGPDPQIAFYSRVKGRLLAKQILQKNQSTSQTTPESLFYHHDALGSIIGLTNSNSKLVTRYRYDAFGKLLAGDTIKNQYTFAGKRLDPESGLYHFHFRQYDAKVGVWTTPDPLGILGGVNLYQYVSNNPVNFRDWLGLCKNTTIVNDNTTLSSTTMVNNKETVSSAMFGLGGEHPSLGRDKTFLVPGKFPALAIEVGVPFAHNFAVIHDSILTALGFKTGGLGDLLMNIPSMPVAYIAAVLATPLQAMYELVKDPLSVVNSIGGWAGNIANFIEDTIEKAAEAVSGFFAGNGNSTSTGTKNPGTGGPGIGGGSAGFGPGL